ncbi:glycosyltransferase family 1 protein [Zopfia rhizophila CBS 207.26]|uniref:Glycosyltransferase family 1 protein n=1 Tax=Zopfia rhizophila CBS 207.26 TaxID=1314779 RepID=A0A6A6EDA1_9PEZI|nr:glycosyltransferase family 1 protein [Zopfia rhizophila CBS 207.26]
MKPTNSTHLVVSVAFQDAGDATRAIHLASALRENCPVGHDLKVTFLSNGSKLEHLITNAGFPIVHCQPHVKGQSVAHDLGWDFPEFFGSEKIARDFIEGQLAALRELRPDVVLHGMWAPASLAARMLGIHTISFLPLPVHPAAFGKGLIRDLPDMMPGLTHLPRPMRQWLAGWSSGLMLNAPIFRQHRLGAAAAACGWGNKGPISLFDMAKADLNLVNDLPMFHADYSHRLPDDIVISGPLFSRARETDKLDPDIVAHMRNDGGPAILVTMGSSGTKDFLFEAIRAFTLNREDNWNVVILASHSICSLDEARAVAGDDFRLLVTDRFIPAPAAHALADVVVSHGGQGTVQTAMNAGTPIVGVALQIEQQTNLDNVMNAGAGIRVQRFNWKGPAIYKAIRKVLADPNYTARATALAEKVWAMDGAQIAADTMWNFIQKR